MSTKQKIIPALLLAATPVMWAAKSPASSHAGKKLPDSYLGFFPSASFSDIFDPGAQSEKFDNLRASLSFGTRPAVKRPLLEGTDTSPMKAGANDADLYGYLFYFQGSDLERGIYRISPSAGSTFLWSDSYTSDWSMNMTSGWLRDGNLCGVNSMIFMGGVLAYGQIELNLQTGEILNFFPLRNDGEDHSNTYLTMAYRDLDDHVYGYGYTPDGGAYSFNSAEATNIDTSTVVREVEFENVCVSLCYNMQDDLFYGVTTGGSFVSIDAQGNQTTLFNLNVANFSSTVTGLVYSPKDGKYIWNAYFKGNSSAIYEIDPAAKKATKLRNCPAGEEYIYMVCPDDNVLPTAPASPSSVSYDFVNGSHNGAVEFSLPTKTVSGVALEGSLEWRVLLDGTEIKTGTGTGGSKITAQLEGLPEGNHTLAVSCANDNNWSMPDISRFWIGTDYPIAPTGVELTETSVRWQPVTQSVHDGYVDFNAVKYVVTLNGKKVGETSGTQLDIVLPQNEPFTSYTAEVKAIADNKISEPGTSNFITYGEALEINPSIHYRPEEKEFELFRAIDIDGKTDSEGNPRNWHFSETMGFPSFASGADGEDLLVFPPMAFTSTDKAYLFRMEAGVIHDRDVTGSIEVLIGKEPTLEAMKQVIMPPYKPQHMLADVLTEYFAVSEPGTYYIGILTKTNEVGIHISDMDISITDRAADVPMSVTDIKAEAGPDGALTATVSFTLPTMTVNGKPIPADKELTARVVSREYVHNNMEQGEVTATKTITGKPGAKLTTEIETIQNLNTIGVVCLDGALESSETVTSLYTGLVKPYIVQNLKSEISEDNMSTKLSWTPPVEGGEDGPIGDTFFYTVWYYADGWQHLQNVGWDELEAEVELPADAEQQILMLGVMALNAAGQSDYISSLACVLGTPYTLPMNETFPDYMETYSPIVQIRPSEEYNGTYWQVNDPAEIAALFANPSKVAYIGYIGQEGVTSARSRISLPKFSTVGTSDIKFTLTYWAGLYEAPFTLLAGKHGMDTPEKIGDFPTGKGWISNSLYIPESFNGEKWIELFLDNRFDSANNFALFSGYSISGVSAVESLQSENNGGIFVSGGMLHVAGFAGEQLIVTDIQGNTVVSVKELEDIAGFVLSPGIYVAKAGSITRKIIIR